VEAVESVAVEEAGGCGLQYLRIAERLALLAPDDTAVICTTSGTTAEPKLAEISHRNMLEMARRLGEVDPMGPRDRYVSFLPFAWMGEQMLAVACGMLHGFTISFPESADTQRGDLREIGPSLLFSPPRIWESMLSQIQVRVGEAGWLKRSVFSWAYRIGERVNARRVAGRRVGPPLRVLRLLAEWLALRPVRDQLGLARSRRCYTGGAPLGPDLFAFFHAIGVNLKQIYGQTEICGIAVVHRDDGVSPHTVGQPLPGTELRLTDDGEILLRSAAVFRGYHGNPKATNSALDGQGWLHTGDAGYLDDAGHLVVVDRVAEVLHAHDGTRFSPAFVENKLKFSSYVEDAVVFGGPRPDGTVREHLHALVTVDLAALSLWAERRHLSYTTYRDLAANPDVYELIEQEISRANQSLPESTRVRRFVLLHKPFDPDDDEITRTRKVRRPVIAQRYAEVIAALDDGLDVAVTTGVVSYQDGSRRTTELRLRIAEVLDRPAEAFSRREIWRGVS
jgi:long-chain acyl-CoA synthetase